MFLIPTSKLIKYILIKYNYTKSYMANKDDKKDFSLISIDPAEVNDKFINNEDLNIHQTKKLSRLIEDFFRRKYIKKS